VYLKNLIIFRYIICKIKCTVKQKNSRYKLSLSLMSKREKKIIKNNKMNEI